MHNSSELRTLIAEVRKTQSAFDESLSAYITYLDRLKLDRLSNNIINEYYILRDHFSAINTYFNQNSEKVETLASHIKNDKTHIKFIQKTQIERSISDIAIDLDVIESRLKQLEIKASHLIQKEIKNLLLLFAFAIGFLLLLAYTSGCILAKSISGPLQNISTCLLELCQGNTKISIPRNYCCELGILSSSIEMFRKSLISEKITQKNSKI